LEPNPAPAKGCKARFIPGFFDETFQFSDPFDTVVHSHVFEHFFEPDQFMQHLSMLMPLDTKLVFSIPNLQIMMQRKYTNFINFEHTVMLTEPYVEYLLTKHGFQVVAKKYFLEDHSIFYSAVRTDFSRLAPKPFDPELYSMNRALYLEYADYHLELVQRLNAEMRQANSPIYLFGAHVFTQYLLAFGLDSSKILNLIDNDHSKHGKRLYGTDLMVDSPRCLEGLSEPLIVLRSGVYNDEVKADILNNINRSARFLE